MKTKLRTTYLVTVLFFLFVTVGSMILFYNMFSEEFIISNNKDTMDNLFETIQEMNLAQLTKEEKNVLKDYTDKGGFVTIMDGEKIIYQSKLYCGNDYNFDAWYSFFIYMAQRTVKPIEKLGKLAKKMENNEPINFEEYDFPNNEIGNLSDQMKSMYLKISSNLNELNNYNYLLKTQNKELIEFDERRKKFIRAATHELKTPLAIISTQLEMMNMDNDEAMSEYYESIMEEIQKMSNLIREMLNSSFEGDIILSGPMKVDSLSELLDGMKDKYMGLFWSKKANCRFDIEDNIYINMNNEQIEQAINNYIINAYEHIPEKGTAVVTLKSVDDKAVISVFNNGHNIKEEELSKIWEGFYQTDERVKESNVGLGLYIVRNIVKNHNGVCYAKNHHNGVEFVMEFNRTDKY